MADEVDVDDEKQQHDAPKNEEHSQGDETGEQREEKKRERGKDSGSDGLALAAAVILASQFGRGARHGTRLPPLGRPGDVRVRTTSGDGWWCW